MWRKVMNLSLLILLSLLAIATLSCASADDALERGNEFFEARRYEEAVEEYTKALEIDPKYAGAYYNRGYAYYLMGRYDRSIADYSESLRLEPDGVDAYIGRGDAHAANYRSFENSAENYHKAIADYDTAISLDPGNALAYYSRGNAYHYTDEFVRAIADYDMAITLFPHYQRARDSRRRAFELIEQYENAIADYDKTISVQPDTAYLYYGRGLVHKKLGNDAEARQDFIKTIELGGYGYKNQIESALTNKLESAKYRSHSPEAHEQGISLHTRALSRLAQADYDNAVADTDKARKLIDPQLIHLYTDDMHHVYFQSAIAYYDTGLYDDAIILFDKAINVVLSPSDYPDAYYWRGMSHYRKGSHRRAIADFDMLVGKEGDFPDAAHYRELSQEKLSR